MLRTGSELSAHRVQSISLCYYYPLYSILIARFTGIQNPAGANWLYLTCAVITIFYPFSRYLEHAATAWLKTN